MAEIVVEEAEHGLLRDLLAYWEHKRDLLTAETELPARADIDPLEMRRLLGHLVLIDRVAATEGPGPAFHYRLVGVQITERAHKDFTGRIDELGSASGALTTWLADLERCMETGRPVLRRGLFPWREASELTCEWGLFPLASDRKRPDKVLAGIFFPRLPSGHRPDPDAESEKAPAKVLGIGAAAFA